jgi:hypothetical protein
MPKFTFICDHNDKLGAGPVVTYETERLHIDDVLFDFTDFLRGCGFVFDGDAQIVTEGEMFKSEDDFDEVNFDRDTEESKVAWQSTVNSLMNPPKFRANEKCNVCGLPSSVMEGHKCWDQKCPIQTEEV